MNSNKTERVRAIIIRNLSEIIQMEIKNPKLGFVSIPEIKVSNDLSHAKIYVSFFDDKYSHQKMEILEKAKGFIRTQLAKKMATRRVPELTFELDETYKNAQHLEEILKKVNK